jgi:predicted permease
MLHGDFRYTLRKWRRKRVETATLIVTLAIGIGLPATIATLAYAVQWGARPGVYDPETLAWVVRTDKRNVGWAKDLSYPEYLAIRDRGRGLFDRVTAQMRTRARLEFKGEIDLAYGDVVAGQHFEVLGTRPALGRFFSADAERAEVTLAHVVLSWRMWKRLGSDPALVGKTIRMNGKSFTVVGVTQAGFGGLEVLNPADFWIPIGAIRLVDPKSVLLETRLLRDLRVTARLRPGVTVGAATAFVESVFAQLAVEFPQFYPGMSAEVVPIRGGAHPDVPGSAGRVFRAVFVVSCLLLLVVCVNVAGVLGAASLSRHHELALRMALGASRSSIVRQTVSEGVMLALAGGTIGLALMFAAPQVFGAVIPLDESIIENGITVYPAAIAFSVGLMVLAGTLAAALPAVIAARASLAAVLQQHGPAGRQASGRFRGFKPLLVVQIAIAFAFAASLVPAARAIRDEEAHAFGLPNPDATLFASVRMSKPDSNSGADSFAALRNVLVNTEGLTDFTLAGATRWGDQAIRLPIWESSLGTSELTRRVIDVTFIDERFTALTGKVLVWGRDISAADRRGAPLVSLANEAAATLLRATAAGPTMDLRESSPSGRLIRIVGAVRDRRIGGGPGGDVPRIYLSLAQFTDLVDQVELLARAPRDSRHAAARLRNELARLGAEALEVEPTTVAAVMRDRTAEFRTGVSLLLVASAGTLLLAALGIYAQVHSTVRARTREIGIRMAIGARPGRIVRLMLRDSALALSLGLLLGGWSAPWLQHYVLPDANHAIVATPQTWMVASLGVVGVFVLSVLGPTRRALRIHPASSLREDLG